MCVCLCVFCISLHDLPVGGYLHTYLTFCIEEECVCVSVCACVGVPVHIHLIVLISWCKSGCECKLESRCTRVPVCTSLSMCTGVSMQCNWM